MKKTILVLALAAFAFGVQAPAQTPAPKTAAAPVAPSVSAVSSGPSPVALATPAPAPQTLAATAILSASALQAALDAVPSAPLSLQTLLGRVVTLPAGVSWSQVRTLRVDIPPGGSATIRVTYSH